MATPSELSPTSIIAPIINGKPMLRLLNHHLQELRASGISDETILAAGIYSETLITKIAALLNHKRTNAKQGPAIVFPFFDVAGQLVYSRVKRDRPRLKKGRPIKYESPVGQPNQIYLPPGVAAALDNPSVTLWMTEGEKKSLKATQEGFPCIGLVGVYGWMKGKKSTEMLPALERVTWQNRKVLIAFDSDGTRKPEVQDAQSRLAAELSNHGATVRIVQLPDAGPDEDGKPIKMGLDDFLVAHGPADLSALASSAAEPAPVDPGELRSPASELDPSTEGEVYLASTMHEGVITLRFYRGGFLRWEQGRYVEVMRSEVRATLIQWLNRSFAKLGCGVTANVMDQVQAQSLLSSRVESPAWLSSNAADWPPGEVLVARNGLVHIPSLVAGARSFLKKPTPNFFTSAALSYDFNLQAVPPNRWLEFLHQLWGDDQQSIELLQEWFGYMLTQDTTQQKILALIGSPRSGKGTIARILTGIIGKQNVAGPTLASFGQNFGLWPLLNKSLAIISDARLGSKSDQAVIVERLLSISGEDSLTVDRKMMEPVFGKLPTRLMIVSNELPRLMESSGAFSGRILMLQLRQSFYGREDVQLTDKLMEERPSILLWAIEGWRRLHQRGRFQQPESGLELLDDLRDLSSPIGLFVRDQCDVGPAYSIARPELFAAYKAWAKENGREHVEDAPGFGRGLRAVVPDIRDAKPRNESGKQIRAYQGIKLKPVY